MPLILSAGVSRKTGLPNYGSLGATCEVQLELPASLLETDPDTFRRHVRNDYIACAEAVDEELARRQAAMTNGSAEKTGHHDAQSENDSGGGRVDPARQEAHGHNGQQASPRQIDFVCLLADRIRGLGASRLDTLTQSLFDKPMADLSGLEASRLIDTLKDIRAGKTNLEVVLNEAAM